MGVNVAVWNLHERSLIVEKWEIRYNLIKEQKKIPTFNISLFGI